MREIILHGTLGRKFGRRHRFDIATPAEAVRALCANFPAFAHELRTSGERGVGYRVFIGREAVADPQQLAHPVGAAAVRIAPVVMGAGGDGKGVAMVFVGVALMAFAGPLSVAFVQATGVSLAATTIPGIGMALALSGVAAMLTPTPKAPTPNERPENTPSYTFDGPINTTAQGQAVPLAYGELIVGSAVISGGIDVDEYAVAATDTNATTEGGAGTTASIPTFADVNTGTDRPMVYVGNDAENYPTSSTQPTANGYVPAVDDGEGNLYPAYWDEDSGQWKRYRFGGDS